MLLIPFRADQGRFLDYIVSWGNLTEERVALYLTEILEALHYLHTWRIAHLDLKVNVYPYNSVGLSNKSVKGPISCSSLLFVSDSSEVVSHVQSSRKF